jgi:N-acetylmuramoyl-L-alanine amidase
MTKLVVIDPGHGGHDSGATGHGLRECDVTLNISKRIKRALLRDFDVDVKLTRPDDRFVSLDARAKFANDRNAAYFVAVHINSASSASASGYEDYVHTNGGTSTESRRGELHASVAAFMHREGVQDRGKKRANFAVLRETDMPAILTESLFISTASDARLLADASFLNGLAEAHARGIAAALDLARVAVPVA